MSNDFDMSASEAAVALGVDKTTIIRAIKRGKLNGTKNEWGDWRIAREQLPRQYPRRYSRRRQQRETDNHELLAALDEIAAALVEVPRRLSAIASVLRDNMARKRS